MLAPTVVPFIVAPLMAFAVYRRVRGSFGRQRIRTRATTIRIAILSLLAIFAMTSGLMDVRLAEGVVGGLVLGGGLALVGLRLTRFESGADGTDFYVPNPWVGGALTALLVGRLAWRFLVLSPVVADGGAAAAHTAPPGYSPLTMAVVGLTLGYYIAYYAGILVRHRRHKQALQAAV
jgi:hypothetical protein